MFDINMIKTGTIARTRGGSYAVFFWRQGELYVAEGTGCYKFKIIYTDNGLISDAEKNSSDIMELFEPDSPVIFYITNKYVLENPIWIRREIDWANVKPDTPVFVSNDGNTWKRRHFYEYDCGRIFTYPNGKSAFTALCPSTTPWKYAKLA